MTRWIKTTLRCSTGLLGGLFVSATLAGPLAAQERIPPLARDTVSVRTTIPARQAMPGRSEGVDAGAKPRSYLEEAQNIQLAELAAAMSNMKSENDALRIKIANLTSDIDTLKALNRPPPGYTAAFTTKRNWDGLEDGAGFRYYSPVAR